MKIQLLVIHRIEVITHHLIGDHQIPLQVLTLTEVVDHRMEVDTETNFFITNDTLSYSMNYHYCNLSKFLFRETIF